MHSDHGQKKLGKLLGQHSDPSQTVKADSFLECAQLSYHVGQQVLDYYDARQID